jgi:hypothetical protein
LSSASVLGQTYQVPENYFNFTGTSEFTDSQLLQPNFTYPYIVTTVFGNSVNLRHFLDDRFGVFNITIQNTSAEKILNLHVNSSGEFATLGMGYSNNTLSSGGTGEGLNFNCDFQYSDFTCDDLGNGFSIAHINISETAFGLNEPEGTLDMFYITDFSGEGILVNPIDNINFTENGVTTYFDDFSTTITLGSEIPPQESGLSGSTALIVTIIIIVVAIGTLFLIIRNMIQNKMCLETMIKVCVMTIIIITVVIALSNVLILS